MELKSVEQKFVVFVKSDGNFVVKVGGLIPPVTSVNGKLGDVVLDKSDIGLGNVDNTSDIDKPISTAVQNALDQKADASNVVNLTSNQTINGLKTFNNNISLNSNRITNLGSPINNEDGVNKLYLDSQFVRVLFKLTEALEVTGTTEIQLTSYTVPGGLMLSNSGLRITLLANCSNNSNNKILTVRMGAEVVLSVNLSNTTGFSWQRSIFNSNSLTSQISFGSTTASYATTVISTPINFYSINTNNNFTISVFGQKSNVSDFFALRLFIIEFLP